MELTKKYGFTVCLLLISNVLQGVFCLQCHVGVNNDTQVLECEGSWDQLQLQMQERLGASWDQLQLNMTTGMTAVIDQLKQSLNLEQLADTVQSALSPTADTRRRKRASEDGEGEPEPEAEAEPEPEAEPGDGYYCIKQSLAGHTLRSCLSKAVADPVRMLCTGGVCVCNDADLCNTAATVSLPLALQVTILMASWSWS